MIINKDLEFDENIWKELNLENEKDIDLKDIELDKIEFEDIIEYELNDDYILQYKNNIWYITSYYDLLEDNIIIEDLNNNIEFKEDIYINDFVFTLKEFEEIKNLILYNKRGN